MEAIATILQGLPKVESKSWDDYVIDQIARENETPGNLTGYDCDQCLNRGYFAILKDGCRAVRACMCVSIRQSLKRLDKSGIASLAKRYTFDAYITAEPWQCRIKEKAVRFSDAPEEKCLLLLGATGAGKTHLATAATVKLIMQGLPAMYVIWPEVSKKLKASITDAEIYEKELQQLRTIEVLYIDDLFKIKAGSQPTAADVSLAFEIFNGRYNSRLTTLVSSEFTAGELIEIDEATAGRLIEWAGEYTTNIEGGTAKNYRLKQPTGKEQ